jgi:hypothetical protein
MGKNKHKIKLSGGGGYGFGQPNAKPATGQTTMVNPFMLPKTTGINVTAKTYPNYYLREWDLSAWRMACDQVMKQGWPLSYAALTSWAYECSPFIQSLFLAYAVDVDGTDIYLVDSKGNKIDAFDSILCKTPWFMQLKREIIFSRFWGFSGLNFDPVSGKIYKYNMQDIDPINRMLRQSSYNFNDGVRFDDNDNMLFIQYSTNYESFLGFMQPITRAFIQMNLASNTWLSAGRRLAFPLMMVGYPEGDGGIDPITNEPVNSMRDKAIKVLQEADPNNGLVFPYTRNPDGSINKSIEVEFEGGKTGGQNAHKIYQEFNNDLKAEISTMVLGGTLTGGTGVNGNRALGEVHERKLEAVKSANIEFILNVLNSDFLPKIAKFYKGFPVNAKFDINRAKKWDIDEVERISPVLQANNLKLTPVFFEQMGLNSEFFEERETITSEITPTGKNVEIEKRGLFSGLKKK